MNKILILAIAVLACASVTLSQYNGQSASDASMSRRLIPLFRAVLQEMKAAKDNGKTMDQAFDDMNRQGNHPNQTPAQRQYIWNAVLTQDIDSMDMQAFADNMPEPSPQQRAYYSRLMSFGLF